MEYNWTVKFNSCSEWVNAAHFESLFKAYLFVSVFGNGDMKVVSYRRCD